MPVSYRLARRALLDLTDIESYTAKTWSSAQAELYLSDLYAAMDRLVKAPDRDISRYRRSAPFRMIAAKEHFIVFDIVGDVLVVLSIMNQAENVERRISRLRNEFKAEIAAVRG